MRSLYPALVLTILLTIGISSTPRPTAFADGEGDKTKKESPKPLTEEQKAAAKEKLREAKKAGTLLKRAQNRVDKYCEDATAVLCKTSIFYGHDEDGHTDVKAFVEFADGSLGIYYANIEPDNDAWMVFEKRDMEDIQEIGRRQDHR